MTGPKVTVEAVRTFCRLRPSSFIPDGGESNVSNVSRYSELHARFVENCRYEIMSRASSNEPGFILRLFQPHFMTTPLQMSRLESSSNFVFDHVFDSDASQGDLFELVARPLLDSFLGGINGCVFCYGQTGAGKTWTVSGADSFESRGLIQRTIEKLFESCPDDDNSSLRVSYMEIYNEQAFDLLGALDRNGTLPRVLLREDGKGTVHFENLSLHAIDDGQETALDLFLAGNLNRVVAATPMNQVSSRSHCVFTFYWRNTKLHFVDLAGSERVMRSGVAGATLREAQNINKSLFHLEHVINALSLSSRHVPYRNSVLTSFLRDSLGGSSRTVMVANVSLENQNYKESVSTCRFAQRCGQIRTNVSVNQYSVTDMNKEDVRKTEKLEMAFPLGPSYEAVTLVQLQQRCGGTPVGNSAELVKSFVNLGMNYEVRCVADLCALLAALTNEGEANKKVQHVGSLDEQVPEVVLGTEMILEKVTRHEWKKVLPIPSVEIEDLMFGS